MSDPTQQTGQPLAHESALAHVTGQARYIDDLPELPGTLHLAFGRSERAHADILDLDLSQVRGYPGVVAVFTASDIIGPNDVSPVADDDPLFADDKVIYHGQALFVVAATSRDCARKAARLAQVKYRDLPAILHISEARAAQLRLEDAQEMRLGDATTEIANASHILEGKLTTGAQDHFYLEGQIAYAVAGEAGQMRVFSSTQHPSEIQSGVAHILGVSSNLVQVEVRRMGGGFGGKETQALLIAAAAALVANQTGRPAKLCLDRDDDMAMTGKRHEFEMSYKVGVDDKGVVGGIEMQLASDCGCSMDLSAAINDRAMFHASNAYFLPAVTICSERFFTNKVSATAFRGFGGPQGMILIERVMDHIADQLNLDPVLVRQRNFYRRGKDITPYGQRIKSLEIPALVRELVKTSHYRARRKQILNWNKKNPLCKRGIALTPVQFGISFTTRFLNQAGALVHVYRDGSVILNHGGTEMGQGLLLKVAQVVADVFGLPVQQIQVCATATDKVPNTSATAASSGSDLNAMAAAKAANSICQRLREVAAKHFGCPAQVLRFTGGNVVAPNGQISFAALADTAYLARVSLSSTGFYATPDIHYDRDRHRGQPFFYYACGAAVSEVEVDVLTGENRVRRVDVLHSVGNSLNPAIDLGQIEGAFIQGMGWLTTEEICFDDKGRLTTHAPSTYKIPACSDRPDHFNIALYNAGKDKAKTIHGSKAVGEPPLMLAISVHAALRAAIADGADFTALDAPATAETVLRALSGS
ncbi:Xanthine dehydrogenase, molybdenum binding subunit [hydrothermal vent metagenome]|uniref:Xanthine dehydrogenase, molybdenum binding subunit n=1 Tax=hydrothermal vent metagenome TaxID=652676 RepID=A0A3B0SCB0_9ZZZZ